MNHLNEKNIIVTGGLGLLGKSIAEKLTKIGANVIILDLLDKNEINKINDFNLIKNKIFYYKCDVTNIKSLKKIEKKIKKKFSKIDVLINAAAVADPVEKKRSIPRLSMFENYSLKDWNKTIRVNLNSLFLCSQIFGKHMLKQKKGSIINVASTYGIVGPDQKIYITNKSNQNFYKNPAYPTSKGGVISFTRYLAAYWGKKGIRVNSVSPGGIENKQNKKFIKKYSSKTLLGRMAKTEDITGIIKFLCSDESSYVTGSNIVVDGGWTSI